MEIPRSLLDELTREVNALSGAAQRQAQTAIGRVLAEWDGEDVAALRTAATAVLDALLPTYTDLSAARAAEFYDASREAQAARGGYRAVADSRRDPKATEGAIRAIVRFAADGDFGRFEREALDRVDTEVRRAANECVAYNVGRDPRKPRYARVPSGDSCGFCLMLASFGYQYTSRSAASHSHRNCDCRVVPDFGGADVSGYDPDGMYARYGGCLSALGGRWGIYREWEALPKAERDSYIARHGHKEGAAFDAYVNKRVSAEIETRDPEWFITGKPPKTEYESGASPFKKEEATAERLARHGFKSMFRKTRDKEMRKTSDVFLIGSKQRVAWDFKSPEGNGNQTVYHQFEEAAGQTKRVVIDFTGAGERFNDNDHAMNQTRRFLNYHYKVETGINAGEEWRFDEALAILKNGAVKRVVR